MSYRLRAFRFHRGVTLVEVIIGLVIILILTGLVVATLLGMQQSDDIDRVAQSIYDDLISIRSRAVTYNTNHRINFLTKTAWKLEAYNSATTNWDSIAETRSMPNNTYITDASLTNAGTNLNATARGLYSFLNNASGQPFVTVMGLGTSKIKIINVFVGGAVEIKRP